MFLMYLFVCVYVCMSVHTLILEFVKCYVLETVPMTPGFEPWLSDALWF